MMGHMDYFSY